MFLERIRSVTLKAEKMYKAGGKNFPALTKIGFERGKTKKEGGGNGSSQFSLEKTPRKNIENLRF